MNINYLRLGGWYINPAPAFRTVSCVGAVLSFWLIPRYGYHYTTFLLIYKAENLVFRIFGLFDLLKPGIKVYIHNLQRRKLMTKDHCRYHSYANTDSMASYLGYTHFSVCNSILLVQDSTRSNGEFARVGISHRFYFSL